jgi:homopolymeric O-antigen transport system ATP-binding protein
VAELSFNAVWKAYPRWDAGGRTLKGLLVRRRGATGRARPQQWALRDVSFRLQPGSSAALIGRNGAGKSTLLRLASGLSAPTRGSVAVPPGSASVLSLGTTFDGTLTGSENGMTAAVIAGLTASEARARLPAILEFAELEAFADAPLRTYSDGMKLRLAFAVVAQQDPAVLLLDEVLAVGDLRFQEKCMARIAELRSAGTSVLLASHSLEQVVEQCELAIWLDGGAVRESGPAADVVAAYRDAIHAETTQRTPSPSERDGDLRLRENRFGSQEATIESVVVSGAASQEACAIETEEPLSVALTVLATRSIAQPIIGIAIHRAQDDVVCCDLNSDSDGVAVPDLEPGCRLEVSFALDRVDLLPGRYYVDVGVYEGEWRYAYDYHWHVHELVIRGPQHGNGVFRPPGRRWRVDLD